MYKFTIKKKIYKIITLLYSKINICLTYIYLQYLKNVSKIKATLNKSTCLLWHIVFKVNLTCFKHAIIVYIIIID